MEDVKDIINNLLNDLANLDYNEYIITPFFDENTQALIENNLKYRSDYVIHKNGGIINSLRNRLIIQLKDDKIKLDFNIKILKIEYNKKYDELSHKSILGSLMGLGIKREVIGDIISDEDNNWYFALTREIYPFIKENFKKVGRADIDLKEIDYEVESKIKLEYKNFFLTSYRLDLVVKDVFYISRNDAQKAIINGMVFVNHLNILKADYKLKIGDEINLRKKGKVKLVEEVGTSRSDKFIVKVGRYV